jgi:diphosphoinositol-polyphosphate diphosphatase
MLYAPQLVCRFSPKQSPQLQLLLTFFFLGIGYGQGGERLVAGVVPLNETKTHVLLIESTRRTGWVLPKGGWETDEECTEAAQREAWEEAGIVCTVDYDLGQITETRTEKQILKNAPEALYQFYQVTVTREEAEWPEMHKRNRRWATYAEAKQALAARPELLQALERSTIQR